MNNLKVSREHFVVTILRRGRVYTALKLAFEFCTN